MVIVSGITHFFSITNLKNIYHSLRVRQAYKNILVFVCVVFSRNLANIDLWKNILLAFLFTCMVSSGLYLINDVLDKAADKVHPVKAKRPVASGHLSVPDALVAGSLLIVLAFLGAYFFINLEVLLLLFSYFVLMLVYSLIIKRVMIVDVLTIGVGFIIRAVIGCLATGIPISPWLVICTYLLAIFLAFGKRRHELVELSDQAVAHRASLTGYSSVMLDHFLSATTAALLVSYFLYTFLTGDDYLMMTIPLAIYSVFRYLFLVHQNTFGDEPGMIFKDKPMVISMVLWLLMVLFILYFIPIWQ